jgi:CubicO group peptidase (beta-lactamase class C family)
VTVAATQTSVRLLDGSLITPEFVDATGTRLMQAAGVTGVGIAIFNDRRPVYVKAYGARDADKHLPLTTESVMTSASFTKVAFAYLVMQLVDEGAIHFDAPIQRYLPRPLPEYEGYELLANDERYRRLTPRMLLDHARRPTD